MLSRRVLLVALATALVDPCDALSVSVATTRPALRSRAAPIVLQEPELDANKVDLVERASDPFRVVRAVIYVTFGVTGFAGCVTSVMQMGDNPGNSLGNLAVNGGVLGEPRTSSNPELAPLPVADLVFDPSRDSCRRGCFFL